LYNDNILPDNPKINVSISDQPVDEVMKKLLEKPALAFKIIVPT
jgi:hypothetical protein